MAPLQFNNVQTRTFVGTIGTILGAIGWITFINSGAAGATITFSSGDSVILGAGDALTLPQSNVGWYDDIIVDATATTVRIVFSP